MKSKKILACMIAATVFLSAFTVGCTHKSSTADASQTSSSTDSSNQSTGQDNSSGTSSANLGQMDFSYTDRDLDASRSTTGATTITLKSSGSTVKGAGATVSGTIVTIKSAGTYVISGTLKEGQLVVAAGSQDKVQLIFNGININCAKQAPVYIKSADKVFITLQSGTTNSVADGTAYALAKEDSSVDAAIFSKADLTLNGTGSLIVKANYKHGIASKDDLIVTGGIYQITAASDALQGKDCVKINGGTFTLNAGADGIKSNNSEDSSKGFISIDGGKFAIIAGNDGIEAETVLRISKATVTMTTGGGSANASTDSKGDERPGWGDWGKSQDNNTSSSKTEESAKGLKAASDIILSGGTFQIDSSDDSIHSNGNVSISGGTFRISSGDDGIHADSNTTISNGTITISKSYEGIEGKSIDIKGGTVRLVASDDGVNAAGGNDSSSMGGRPGQNNFSSSGDAYLKISGGYLVVNASGDGIDVNGSLSVSGGTVLVSGPTNDGNGGLDYDGTADITGGTVIVAGSSGMAQTFSNSSTQNSMMYSFNSTQTAKQMLSITDSSGKVIASFIPMKNYQTVVVSTPVMKLKSSYTIYVGGTVSGVNADGFTANGKLSGGSKAVSITLSSVSTSVNTQSGMGGGDGMGGGRR